MDAAKQLLDLFNTLVNYKLGSLWWIEENTWGKKLGTCYQPNIDRNGHPGVSICSKSLFSLQDTIPILYGSSGHQGPVVAKGLSKSRGADWPTSFGRILRPARFIFQEINDFDETTGRKIRENTEKPKLTEPEEKMLRGYLKKRGIAL